MKDALTEAERVARLRLARTDRIGPVSFLELLRREGSAGRALERLPELARRGGGTAIRIAPQQTVDDELKRGEQIGARLIVLGDEAYPRALAALDAPPPVLWARGRTELLGGDCLAIVGARTASAAGQRFAQGLALQAGQAGHVVVSGMARGVDAAAHEGAMMSGTIAVLGGGVDDVYPPENGALYDRLTVDGCIISESAIGHRAQARDFPRRNRIISGLSRAVIVVEAELRSGSLITARLAAEQGREVLAVPGSPLDPRCQGTNDLIRQGASLCEGMADIARALEGQRAVFDPPRRYVQSARDEEASTPDLAEAICAQLGPTPVSRDDVVRRVDAPAGAVIGALVELSLAGRVQLDSDGSVSRLT